MRFPSNFNLSKPKSVAYGFIITPPMHHADTSCCERFWKRIVTKSSKSQDNATYNFWAAEEWFSGGPEFDIGGEGRHTYRVEEPLADIYPATGSVSGMKRYRNALARDTNYSKDTLIPK